MGDVKIPYYVEKWTGGSWRAYWQPTKAMISRGFKSVALGAPGPESWAKAAEWNEKWRVERLGLTKASGPVYPGGSLGEAFQRFKRLETWRAKKPRTREEWDRAWRYIDPIFGDIVPATVDLETIDWFYHDVKQGAGVREAWRVLKIWRALWRAAAAMGYCSRDSDPSLAIRRQTPAPRTAVWREGEAVRLAKAAIRSGYAGLACCIAVAWDTQFAPVDVRTLRPLDMRDEGGRITFHLLRAKTGMAAIGTLSRRGERVVRAYLSSLGAELHPGAPMFRNRSGRAYSKDTLGDDFRDVRAMVLPGDTRTIGHDMRRSAAGEGFVGGASVAAMASKMANTINQAADLQRTYFPVNKAAVDQVDEARKRGRRALRENK